jgi:preprotein translocase subunit SecD
LIAGLIGLALVAAYMVFYYRTLGFVVVAGLTMSAALMWSLVTWLSATRGLALSLSGAVGIIVSVGVTVDSYVVYFERMRDEIRQGKSVKTAVDRGFQSAWRTIRTADLTSIIGALVLYLLTVGSVRGFAFFLMLSTALDLFVSYFFTRPLVKILGDRGWFSARTLGVEKFATTTESSSTGVLRPGSTNVSTGVRP